MCETITHIVNTNVIQIDGSIQPLSSGMRATHASMRYNLHGL
jgi:hypothetical protein